MSTNDDNPLRVGDEVNGQYVIEDVIDRGGMGVVYLATHIELRVPVAIKALRGDLRDVDSAVERMLQEARIVARLDSDHVARVLDAGRLPGGGPYIVMEHLVGEDLSTTLEERGPLDVEEAVGLILQTCDALAHAHAAKIVHLDLKPANLFLAIRYDAVTTIKVLDFGIASDLRAAFETKPHGLTGSPDYMSPEQVLLGGGLDERSDIWSVGVVLYELLSGRRPFGADSAQETCARILGQPAPSLRAHRPEVPAALEAAISSCLSKDRGSRPPTVAALAAALAEFGPEGAQAAVRRIERVLGLATMLPENAHREALSDTVGELAEREPESGSTPADVDPSPPRTRSSRAGKLAIVGLATFTTTAGIVAGYAANAPGLSARSWPELAPTLPPWVQSPVASRTVIEPCGGEPPENDYAVHRSTRPDRDRVRPHRRAAPLLSSRPPPPPAPSESVPDASESEPASDEHGSSDRENEPLVEVGEYPELDTADGDGFWTRVEQGELPTGGR